MSSLWVGIGALVVGAGTSLYSANAQKKASQSATNANVASQDKVNNSAWASWLMSKGIQPTGAVEAGVVPTAGNYTAINTKLPIWANVNYGSSVPGTNGAMRLVKKGTPTTTGIMGLASTPAVTVGADAGTGVEPTAGTGGGGSNALSKVTNYSSKVGANILDPTGITATLIGDKPKTLKTVAKNALDPLGIFCWAAREAYGENNPKWLQFREWILHSAPVELRNLYGSKAPALAERMKANPALREEVKQIMDGILATT